MTPAHSLKPTRSSNSAQYHRHQTYSDALKNSFFLELFHTGIVCLLLWPMSSPQRSLGHSLFKQKFSQKFWFVLLLFFFFYFIKISKFALPGVMLKSVRSQYDRKKAYSDQIHALILISNCHDYRCKIKPCIK